MAEQTVGPPDEQVEEVVEEEDLNAALFEKRTVGGNIAATLKPDPAFPWPKLDPDKITPSAYAVVVDHLGEQQSETEFHLDEEKMSGLPFADANLPLPDKHLYTIKCVRPDGSIVQVGFEEQIQNTAGGELEDAIGLRRYDRKPGWTVLIDWNTLIPVYCPAWGCWAHADPEFNFFCSLSHAGKTLPNMGQSAIRQGLKEGGVTTSRMWSSG